MQFTHPILKGKFLKRYKRFFADILLENGETITAHCPNTGAMQGLLVEGSQVWVTHNNDPKRKLHYTWEMSYIDDTMVGVNTQHPNKIIVEAIANNKIPELEGYSKLETEVKYGKQNSRIDILLTYPNNSKYFVEVKNVHYKEANTAVFPDSPTTRGVKHLEELCHMMDEGHKAAVVYCIQRNDLKDFRFGEEFDPNYAKMAEKALKKGVKMLPFSCTLDENGIAVNQAIPLKALKP